MIKVRRLRKLLDEINKVWAKYDTLNNWIGVIWLIKKQIEEIEEANYTGDAVLKEVADILIILVRYLDKIGIDPEKLMLHRLNTRHKGKTQAICEKYARIFEEEQLRPKCYHGEECEDLFKNLDARCNGVLISDGQGHSAPCPIKGGKKK